MRKVIMLYHQARNINNEIENSEVIEIEKDLEMKYDDKLQLK